MQANAAGLLPTTLPTGMHPPAPVNMLPLPAKNTTVVDYNGMGYTGTIPTEFGLLTLVTWCLPAPSLAPIGGGGIREG